ncbi:Type III pantothenate kinase [bioreactor metagenome]|uniref:Type III pantothenate kinase n=1 Tax=bioreactor metagenome TaxID=1076179 RepID=A0A645HYB7_9ZZZZ
MVEPGIKTGLNIHIDNPAQLGSDLVAGAVAANAICKKPCIVFDFGTATKATVLDKNGSLIGCLIMHGVKISLEALALHTAQLPHINLEKPSRVIGTNTVESMRSGAVFGAAGMLDGMAERIEDELRQKATVVVTGGLASLIAPYCKRSVTLIPTLNLDGLRLIYQKNQTSDKK